jgi:hypothetical protein
LGDAAENFGVDCSLETLFKLSARLPQIIAGFDTSLRDTQPAFFRSLSSLHYGRRIETIGLTEIHQYSLPLNEFLLERYYNL